MLVDVNELAQPSRVEADVCVVGAGPAGITLARGLAGRGLRVALLESGGLGPEEEVQALYGGVMLSPRYPKMADYPAWSRLRYFGGTSGHWGGWCRPLDPIDFEAREWIPDSGWPISFADVEPYYRPACEIVGIEPFDYDPATGDPPSRRAYPIGDGEVFRTDVFHFSRARFGTLYREELERSERITVYLHANVVNLRPNADGTALAGVDCSRLDGTKFEARAKAYVLATGGIENARLLLASVDGHPDGVGNAHGVVGRYFMDHMDVTVGALVLSSPQRHMNLYRIKKDARFKHRRVGVLSLRDSALRKHRLLNACLRVDEWLKMEDLDEPSRQIAAATIGLDRLEAFSKDDKTYFLSTLRLAAEQAPTRESRVVLADQRDALGMRRVRVEWKPTATDHESVKTTLGLLGAELGRTSCGRVRDQMAPAEDPDWAQIDLRVCKHHIGTTRMHQDPKRGVTDANGRVHGVENLYVAGSSVFTTSGYANPTLTIVALALRMAEHLGGVAG